MIRINLLATERAVQKKAPAGAPSARGAYILLFLFVGGALVLCGGAWWWESQVIERLNSDIGTAQKRQAQLQEIKRQVDVFEAKKKTLEAKVNLIERLKAEQSGPVHMLDEISKALPDFVWLTSMDQAGAGLKFSGQANSLSSVADFISALQKSGWFPQVDPISNAENENIVTFALSATFKSPEVAAKEKAAAAAAPPAPAAAPAVKKP